MKKWYVVVLFCMCGWYVARGQETRWTRANLPKDWHLRSVANGGMYGAAVYDAYDYLKGVEPKRKVVVAVLDGGADTSHEDLKKNLWVNVDEIPGNGMDDDHNGYVDDVFGWNFLGTPDGGTVDEISTEADRYYMYLKNRFEGVDTNRLSKKELELHHFYTRDLPKVSALADAYKNYMEVKMCADCVKEFDRELKTMYPGVELTKEHFESLQEKYAVGSIQGKAFVYIKERWSFTPTYTCDKMFKMVSDNILKVFERRCNGALRKFESDGRAKVGDDMGDIKDRFYGNATMTAHEHGSHVAGIIGATRNNGIGIEGVADVQLMSLRVCTGTGDEYNKDLATAIRYAVENGANIINISLGRSVSMEKEWVDDALRFAEKKGVLVVHAAGNEGRCTDGAYNYPSKHLTAKKTLGNFINVGNSYADGLPVISSNFGKEEVDLFAQGGSIYSAITGNDYKSFTGTSMAAPVVAGVAALIWNYFPELSVSELKQVLLDGVTSRRGIEVATPKGIKELGKDKVYFDDLCTVGGILNALESVKLAEKICKNKK